MKNTELRIGNYVEIYGKVETIVDVLCDCVNTLNIEGAHYGLVNPIPLTKDWLEKFGFEKTKFESSIKTLKYEWTSIYFNNGYVEISVSGHSCPVSIQHVHQLQNLYFELTGEELKIKN